MFGRKGNWVDWVRSLGAAYEELWFSPLGMQYEKGSFIAGSERFESSYDEAINSAGNLRAE